VTAAVRAARRHTPRFADVLASEWTKLWTLRSTAYTVLAFVVLALGLTVLISSGSATEYRTASPADRASFNPTGIAMFSLILAQMAVMVLGVLAVTGEYATGMIRVSLTVAPRRGRLLAAKVVVFGAVMLALGTAVGFSIFFLGQAVLAHKDVPSADLGQPGVLRAVAGAGLYLTALGLLAVAVGILVRATAAGITAMVTGVLIMPSVVGLLPGAVAEPVRRFWPTIAGSQIMEVQPVRDRLAPWPGFAVMCLFVAAMLGLAYVQFRRRDA
jgi:ABC-2 type transport system permease protein